MKKIKLFMLSAVVVMGFGISSCGGDGPGGVGTQQCADAAEGYYTSFSNFISDPSNESKCEAWKSALNRFIDKCNINDYFTQQEYQDLLDDLDATDCGDL
ncbi:MAG: hypothetical protein R2753_13570 [Chitinophagales bacterium]